MKVLIIGGTGFIGSVLTRRLIRHGHETAVYNRGETRMALPPGVTRFVSSERRLPIIALPIELLRFEAEIVIHTMAMGKVDAETAGRFFQDKTGRMVMLSSGDVYSAYGRFIGTESGPPDSNLLTECSPLRTVLFPYRSKARSQNDLEYWYDKTLGEKAFLSSRRLPTTILRLPKVYGAAKNSDLATVFGFRDHPHWRWTHGYVGNIAEAIVLAAVHPRAEGKTYNLGEPYTPTMEERLERLPPSAMLPEENSYDFRHNLAYDTTRIRTELLFSEPVPEAEAMALTFKGEIIPDAD